MWNLQNYMRHDEEADTLIDLAADFGLSLMILPGTITFSNASTAIDLVWGNDTAMNCMLQCRTADDSD